MAANQTTLTGDLTSNGLTLAVASVTGATVGRQVRINNERIGAIIEVIGLSVRVRGRGDAGTFADAHSASSPVIFGDAGDFPTVNPTKTAGLNQQVDQDSYLVDGAIVVPANTRNLTAVLMKGSAGAYTLAAPSLAQDGVVVKILAGTAFAHVVTATTLYQDGVIGGAKSTATFAAFVGSNLIVQALKGTWYVIGKNVVTIT